MSSNYRILCLNHDPAIRIDHDWTNAPEAIAAACDPASHEAVQAHQNCDLLVGRYSYPLIQVCCPPRTHLAGPHPTYVHREPQWIDVKWLHILHAAKAAPPNERLKSAIGQVEQCWTTVRLGRLRDELGIEPGQQQHDEPRQETC